MRKRRNLASKLKIVVFALAVAVSAFFYIPMSVSASVSSGTKKTVSVTYNNSADNICVGNTYLPWNYNIESQWLLGSNYDYEKSNFWYKGTNQKLFDSEAKYYGYSVKITRTSKTSCQFTNASANYWVVGTATQLMNGENRGGVITSTSYTAWVPTENSIQAVHMAPFFYFNYLQMPDGDWVAGEYDINCIYYVEYTGYETKDDYNSALNSIQAELEYQTTELEDINDGIGDLNTGIDNLTNGYDTSTGESMNDEFASSIDSYVSVEDNLFTSAKDGLSGFEFINVASYPILVTALSFVTGLMSSAFIAMGGESGVIGIVLAVLFSIMLVSMAIGLYRFYQTNGKGGGD